MITDLVWTAEFRGLFWGEGCADIQRFHRGRGVFYRPRLRISLRADDRKMLEQIKAAYGGTLVDTRPDGRWDSKPSCTWTLTNKEAIVKVCDVLLDGKLNAKKAHQIKLVREAAWMRANTLSWISEVERKRLQELYEMLQQMKRYE